MERIGYIYKLTAPNGKVYIGQTTRIEGRMHAHSKAKGKAHLQNSIRTYGWDSFQKEIICSGPFTQEGLNQLEIHFIRIYNSFRKGLNMTEGGGGMRGYRHSIETTTKTQATKIANGTTGRGRKQSLETILKREAAKIANGTTGRGKKLTPEHVAKLSEAKKGKKLSPEHILKISGTKKGKKLGPKSMEHVAKISAAKQKPISQYTKEGVWIRDWNSAKEAGETLGVQRSDISNCLAGRIKSAGGFVWKYVKKS